MNLENKETQKKIIYVAIGTIVGMPLVFGSIYKVDEGYVGIVKRFGKAIDATDSGLHLKFPFADSIETMEIRTRKFSAHMQAATTGKNDDGSTELQMPSQVTISANWNIPKESALEIYKKYGGLTQYEGRILTPRVLKVTKGVFPNYSIESIISNREQVTLAIAALLSEALSGFSVKMTDVNIENVEFPVKVKEAVEKKQVAKQNFQTERYTLEQQNLKAQQQVNTANAEAESIRVKAIAQAEATRVQGEAEAQAMKFKAAVLNENPRIIELEKIRQWDGKLPVYLMGGDAPNIFLGVNPKNDNLN